MSKHETDHKNFKPFVSADACINEFSFKAVILGVFLAIIFGMANAYLGLKVGMTVSASIPAAVMSMGILRLFFKKATILENNMAQTIGSAGESLAAGVIFTVPALIIWGFNPSLFEIFFMALLGGWLGVLFMIPLRRYLIVREHGKLPYPEGAACAKVLIAGETGGNKALVVFKGLMIGFAYKFCMSAFKMWHESFEHTFSKIKNLTVGIEALPSLLGVGFIIGPKIASYMLAGAVLGWLVIIPLISLIGANSDIILYPASVPLKDMGSWTIWNYYLRYIGAGAVAFGGIVSLITSIPTIFRSFKLGFSEIIKNKKGKVVHLKRTQKDLSMKFVLYASIGFSILIAVFLYFNLSDKKIENTKYRYEQPEYKELIIKFSSKKDAFYKSILKNEIDKKSPYYKYDINKNNKIDEIDILNSELKNSSIIKSMDLDKNSKIDKDEYLKAKESHFIKTRDLNGDSKVSLFEKIKYDRKYSSKFHTNFLNKEKKLDEKYLNNLMENNKVKKINLGITGAILAAILITFFAFFFVTVSSRIVGLVGSSSNPASGMTIATLLITSLILLYTGYTGDTGKILSIMIGAFVCIAICISGDTSQDLKTGYLVGATPRKQQFGEFFGTVSSAFFVGLTVYILHQAYTIGSKELAAPQATLMALVIDGVMNNTLPWTLVFIGIFSAGVVELLGINSLAFAIGLYLPLHLSTPIMLGGIAKIVIEKLINKRTDEEKEEVEEKGILMSSGLIAGEALCGVIIAFFVYYKFDKIFAYVTKNEYVYYDKLEVFPAVGIFALLFLYFINFTLKRKKQETK